MRIFVSLTEAVDASSQPSDIPRVYCDMDGVLADFHRGFLKAYPEISAADIDAFIRHKGWATIGKEHPRIFDTLPKLPDADRLMSDLLRLRDTDQIQLFILTAIPSELSVPTAADNKRDWIRRYYPSIPKSNVLVVRRSEKQDYAMDSTLSGGHPAILIDDFTKNIKEWEQAGGIGILHTSAQQTLPVLHKLLKSSAS